MSLSFGRIPTIDTILRTTGGNLQKIHELYNVPEFLRVAAAMEARRYHDAVQASANPNPPTIAAQAFGNPPGLPVGAAETPPAGGLGATPEAAQMQAPMPAMGAPEMPAEEMPVEEAPMMADGGMVPPYASGGGLSDVPVPDGMFDEPSNGGFNDGYAGGGIVAFAAGDSVASGYGDFFENTVRRLIPNVNVTSRKRTAAENTAVGGVPNSFHRTGAARDFTPPKGMTMEQLHAKIKAQFGDKYDVINEGDHVHIEPGPSIGASSKPGAELAPAAQQEGNSLYGMPVNFADIMDMVKQRMPGVSEERKAARAEVEAELTPEARKKAKEQSIWNAVTKFGARWGSTPGDFLQAGLSAAGETVPELQESIKADKAEAKDLRKQLVALEDMDRKDELEALKMGIDLSGVQAKLAESIADRETQVALKQADMQMTRDLTEMKIGAERIIANMQVAAQQYGIDNSDLKRMIAIKANAGKAAWAAANPKKKIDDGVMAVIYDEALSAVLGERYKSQGTGLGGILNPGAGQGGQRPSLDSFEG
jgi:hypothetical protein